MQLSNALTRQVVFGAYLLERELSVVIQAETLTQNVRFDGHHVGCDPDSGLTFPPLEELVNAYSFMYRSMRTLDEFPGFAEFPMVVEVFVDPEWQQFPRVMASKVDGELRTDDMERMSPYE